MIDSVDPGRLTRLDFRVREMSSSNVSMGAMNATWFVSDQARTWPQTRPVDLSKTQAPESPGAVNKLDFVITEEMV